MTEGIHPAAGERTQTSVTIGLPTYNRAKWLPRALRSAMDQTHANLEILVSDNASDDDTEALCRAAAMEDARIRYVRQETNLGFVGNWAWLRENARGTYFMWHADDDRFDPTFVEKAARHLDSDPSTVLCFAEYDQVDDQGNPLDEWRFPHLHPQSDWRIGKREFFCYPFSNGAAAVYGLFRRSILQEIPLFRPRTHRKHLNGAEAPFLAEVARRGRIVYLPELLHTRTSHRIAGASAGHEMSKRMGRWELILLYASLEASMLSNALRAKGSVQHRLALAGVVLGATAKKGKELIVPRRKDKRRPPQEL